MEGTKEGGGGKVISCTTVAASLMLTKMALACWESEEDETKTLCTLHPD